MTKAKWLIEGRVIHYYFAGEGSIEQLQEFNQELSAFIEEGEPPLYVVFDIRQAGKPLLNLPAIAENMSILRHEKIQWVITYGLSTNQVFRFLGNVLTNMLGIKTRMFNSKQEVYEFIAQVALDISYDDLLEGEKNLVSD